MQALQLAALAALLPLPLRHHLWVQALALHAVYKRILHLARLHARLPGGGAQCSTFVAAARLGLAAFVPGSMPPAWDDPPAAQACWMAHVWSTVMVGYALPAAVAAALEQWRRQLAAARHDGNVDASTPPASPPVVHAEPPAGPLAAPGDPPVSSERDASAPTKGWVPQHLLACALARCLLLLLPLGVTLFAALELAAALM